MALTLGLARAQMSVAGLACIAGGVHRRHQQARVPVGIADLHPCHRRRIVAARATAEPRHDHRVELESLRLVDRHHADALVGRRVGTGLEIAQCEVEGGEILEYRTRCQPLHGVEVAGRIGERRRSVGAGRAAQREPRGFEPAPQRHASLPGVCRDHDVTQARESALTVLAHRRDALYVVHGGQHAVLRRQVRGKRVQIGEGQSAPGGAQHREPGDAVVRMQQCARERMQVGDDRPLGEALDVDRLVADARIAQRRGDFRQMTAIAHEYRDASVGVA